MYIVLFSGFRGTHVPTVVDPSNEIAEVLVEALEWNMMSPEWNVSVSDLRALHRKSVSLLELLKAHLPDRVGWAQGWSFEKAQICICERR
jgi:hypothetical protein